MAKFSGINRFNPELKTLVRLYFTGEISRPDYRRQRRDLIDKIVSNNKSPAITSSQADKYDENYNTDHFDVDADADDQENDLSDTKPYDSSTGEFQWNGNTDSDNRSNRSPSTRPGKGIDKWFVVAVIIVTVYLGFSLFKRSDGALQPTVSNTDTALQLDSIKQPKELINRFMKLSIWTSVDIDSFIEHWNKLPVSQREDAKSAPWFHEFNLNIKMRYEKYKQQAQAGSGDAARMQLILLQLANAINT